MKALSIAAVAAFASVSGIGSISALATGYDSAKNQPSYWGNNCYKIETGLGATYTAPAGVTKVIVKGGTDNAVYTSGTFTNLTAPINPNNGKPYGISHVIVCTDTRVTVPETPAMPEAPKDETKPTTPAEQPKDCASKENADKENCGKGDEKPATTDKEDKNQSACNPSDTNSANPKHHDDGVNCKDDKAETPSKPVTDQGKGSTVEGDKEVKAVNDTPKAEVKTEAGTGAASALPTTGASLAGIGLAAAAGIATYVIALKRR